MGFFSNESERIEALERKVAYQQYVIEVMAAHLGLNLAAIDPQGLTEQERQLVLDGKKIMAIKTYRERTGAGLAYAKNVIDRAEESL